MIHAPRRPFPSVPARRVRRRRPAGESGSAYIIVLLVLVVLTILGLSLALVTQTERQIGASEKTVQRVFASAESGIALAVAKAMVLGDPYPLHLEIREPRRRLNDTADSTLDVAPLIQRHDLSVSVLMPLLDAPCNLCQVNSGGAYTDNPYKEINHGVISTATRRGWSAAAGDPDQALVLGRQSLSAMIEIQPHQGQAIILSDTTHGNVDNESGKETIDGNPF